MAYHGPGQLKRFENVLEALVPILAVQDHCQVICRKPESIYGLHTKR